MWVQKSCGCKSESSGNVDTGLYLQVVTYSGRPSTLASTDVATPTLRRIDRAAIPAATTIS